MLLTFGEMLGSLYIDLKYGDDPNPDVVTRLKRLLNEAHRTILRSRKMSEARGLEMRFTTAAQQRYYGLPQAFDSINDIRQMDQSICLVMRTRDWLVHRDPQENTIGTPYVWIPNGMQAVARQPHIQGSGLWAVSSSPADTTQTVRVMCVRANAGLVTEQTATLTGVTPVRVGTLSDVAGVMQFTLSAPCQGDVSLIDAPDLPFSFTTPPFQLPSTLPFPTQGIIDSFKRADENPLSGNGQCQRNSWQSEEPLAIVNNRAVQPNPAYIAASSYLNSRFSAEDAEAYVTVTTLPGPSVTYESFVTIFMTYDRPDMNFGPPSGSDVGYHLRLTKQFAGTFHLNLGHLWMSPAGLTHDMLGEVKNLPFAAGDAFGFERAGSLVRVHVRNAGVWRQVIEVPATAQPRALYPSLVIADQDSHLTALNDFGGGPYSSHVLATIDRFAGTSQPYYSIRLWPTPQGPLDYTVHGTLRIPNMVRDEDYPIFMQPEYCDALMTYCRAREYKTVKADRERFEMEQAEWDAVIGGLNAATSFPADYRPVAGAGHRERWSNLGGFYPADIGWGDW